MPQSAFERARQKYQEIMERSRTDPGAAVPAFGTSPDPDWCDGIPPHRSVYLKREKEGREEKEGGEEKGSDGYSDGTGMPPTHGVPRRCVPTAERLFEDGWVTPPANRVAPSGLPGPFSASSGRSLEGVTPGPAPSSPGVISGRSALSGRSLVRVVPGPAPTAGHQSSPGPLSGRSERSAARVTPESAPTAGPLSLPGAQSALSGRSGRSADGVTPGPAPTAEHRSSPGAVSGRSGGSDVRRPVYRLVASPDRLDDVRTAVLASPLFGVDAETTGLDPRRDRLRLLSLATDRGTFLVDCFAVDPRPLFDPLARQELVFHNGLFDLGFLARLGFEPGPVRDTMLMSQLLHAGRPLGHKLADVVGRELARPLDKAQQRSDWSGPLSPDQLRYAAADAEVLKPLEHVLRSKLRSAGLERVAAIEHRCLPAVAWMAAGIGFDTAAWEALAAGAAADLAGVTAGLNAVSAPPAGGTWNWNSPAQVKRAFERLGVTIEKTDEDTLAGLDHSVAGLLRRQRHLTRRVSSYGLDWLKHVAPDGRVYAGWRQIGAASGRMSCSTPNLQQLPRDAGYRRCFVAPPGRVFVKADYSQIELRIAAKLAAESTMLAAYRAGDDLHALTARRLLGVTDVIKDQRQLAKAVNFGLLYGMGAERLRAYARTGYGVGMSAEDAARYRSAFFDLYPGLARWHRRAGRGAGETRTLAGRRRLDVGRFTERLNTPDQGTGADGLKTALALLWERRAAVPGAVPVLAVHDEIVVECDADQARDVADWLTQAMTDAMAGLIDPVPVAVEVAVGPTWGG